MNPPSGWALAPTPAAIDVVPGTATTPARVRLDWSDDAIINRWLQIKILANASTGLTTSQVYYIGHLLGETNGAIEGKAFRVRGTDTAPLVASINPGVTVPVENVYDVNKDGRIRSTDSAPAVAMIGSILTRIAIPPSGSGEEGEGDLRSRAYAAPAMENSKGLRFERLAVSEIRVRMTTELFDVPLAPSPGQSGAMAQPMQAASSSMMVVEGNPSTEALLTLDEYFRKLGQGMQFIDLIRSR